MKDFDVSKMTIKEFFGCTFIAYGLPFALFFFTIAKDPLRTIVLIARSETKEFLSKPSFVIHQHCVKLNWDLLQWVLLAAGAADLFDPVVRSHSAER